MPTPMTHHERIAAALRGDPVDRPPYAFWRHFYEKETSAAGLAEAMLDWQRRHDFDFLKVNPRGQFHAETWGAQFKYSGDPLIKPQPLDLPIKTNADWGKITLKLTDEPPLAEQLESLYLINRGLDGAAPFVATVFSPLSIAGDLVPSREGLLKAIHEVPALVHEALRNITDTFAAFAAAAIKTGAAGIFFATTEWAATDVLTPEDYLEFGRQYDLRVLAAAQAGAWFNILHVCKAPSMVRDLLDYPVHAISWAATDPRNPSLARLRRHTDRAFIGGVSLETMTAETDESALHEVEDAIRQTKGRRWILGPNCSLLSTTPDAYVAAIRRRLERDERG